MLDYLQRVIVCQQFPPSLWMPVLHPSRGGVSFSPSWIWAALWFALTKWSDIVPILAQALRGLVAPTFAPLGASHHAKLEPNYWMLGDQVGERLCGGDEVHRPTAAPRPQTCEGGCLGDSSPSSAHRIVRNNELLLFQASKFGVGLLHSNKLKLM